MSQTVSRSANHGDSSSVVHYTAGSLDYPTPKAISLLKKHYDTGRSVGLELKQDILSTLQFINEQRSLWLKMRRASLRMANTMSAASIDELSGLFHRWIEVGVKCQIQHMKRISLKYNSELQRSYQHGTVNNSNIKHKLMRPEHFERGLPHNKKKALHISNTLVNKQRGVVSPWEGSEFKYEILCSLRAKLLKKLVLGAFKCYARMCQNSRQCISSSLRTKLKRLMQLCFTSILLEALSAKYIVFASNISARKLIVKRFLRPALCRLQLHILHAQRQRALFKQSEVLYRMNMRRAGYRLLCWNARYSDTHRLLARWAAQHTYQHSVLKAFTAWVASFVKKNRMREQIHARLSGTLNTLYTTDNNSFGAHSANTTERNTTLNATLNVNRSSATPLHSTLTSLHPEVVLDQSPLANLRAAVSFCIDRVDRTHAPPAAVTAHNSEFQGPWKMQHSDRGTGGDMTPINYTQGDAESAAYLSKSCQKTLHSHTRQSLRDLRVAQMEAVALRSLHISNAGHNSGNNGDYVPGTQQRKGAACTPSTHKAGTPRGANSTPHTSQAVAGHGTGERGEFSGTREVLLQADVRSQLDASLRARALFPQPRFSVGSSGGGDSSDSPSSSGIGGDRNIYPDADTSGVSSAWRNRHASRDGHSDYVSNNMQNMLHSPAEAPEFSLSTDSHSGAEKGGPHDEDRVQEAEHSSIEDLLLNITTSSTPHSSDHSARSAHHTADKSTGSHGGKRSGRRSRAGASLLDMVIHESFILSSPSPTTANHDNPLSPDADAHAPAQKVKMYTNASGPSTAVPASAPGAYFHQVKGSGTFCGSVEVDSDLDDTITMSERSNHNYDSRNNAGHQRVLVHRQFVEQIQSAFQMIKFRWLIRSCRRFVRTLRSLTQRHKVAYVCAKLHARHTRRRCWTAYCAAYTKQLAAGTLCDRIHSLKLGRRVLKEWRRQSIDRLVPAHNQCTALAARTVCKNTFCKWRGFHQQRGYQLSIDMVLQRSKKVRVLAHWKTYVGLLKQSRAIHYKMSKRVLRPIFQKWRRKYNQRTLLCRVFTVHEDAWRWRSYSVPSPFQRLYSVLTAWKVYTQQSLRVRYQLALQNKALYFRGASLLASHFHQWMDFTLRQRQEHRIHNMHIMITKNVYFHAWAEAVHAHQQQVSELKHRITVRSPQRAVLYAWFRVALGHAVYGPRRHYTRSLVQRAFDYLKTQLPLRLLVDRVLPLCDRTRVKSSFQSWVGILARRASYRKGLQGINTAWLKLKVRQAFRCWPGRQESLLAREMSEYLANKRRERIRLVERGEEQKVVDVVSFVAKRRPTFAQRAYVKRYIENVADLKGLHYYQDLCSTLLQLWNAYIKKYVSVRMRGFAVRTAIQARQIRRSMMHWVLVTPKTSYRRVVWMVRAPRKAHDDYTHKKLLGREFGEKLAKSSLELRYGKNALPGTSKEPHTEDGEYYTDEEEGEYVVQKRLITC